MFDTPANILAIEKFGVGRFKDEELADKSAEVRAIKETRRDEEGSTKFDVLIPAHKEQGYILATLRALAEQTACDCNFVIINNGEPYNNPTRKIAEACGFEVIHEPKKGIALAREIGRQYALEKKNNENSIVVTTDADAIPPPEWLQSIADYMDKNPGIVAGTGRLHMLSKSWRFRALQEGWDITRMLMAGRPGPCMEANTFFRNKFSSETTGYDITLTAGENPPFLKQLLPYGKIGFIKDPKVGMYVSARRLEKTGLFGHFFTSLRLIHQLLTDKKTDNYPDIRSDE